MSPLVALILGSGPRVGASFISRFKADGYLVASVSRSSPSSSTSDLALQADFSDSSSIPGIFRTVHAKLGAASVVIYNAAVANAPPDKDNVLSMSPADFLKDFNVNCLSAYVAAQEAVKTWTDMEEVREKTKKTFIFTGNGLNQVAWTQPFAMMLGVGKSAAAYWLNSADVNFKEKGYRFFYADERFADGAVKAGEIDGDAHAGFYASLARHEGAVPSLATFVMGKGYVDLRRMEVNQ